MLAETLLTWDVVMPHDGKLPEAAETEAQYQIDLPGQYRQGQEAAAVSLLRPLCIAAPETAPILAGGGSVGWAGAGVWGCGLQPLLLLFVPLLHDG